MAANDRQVGGKHYASAIQHWDIVAEHELDYFQAQIIKYIMRWKKKNGFEDLCKAQHFLEKYLELSRPKEPVDPVGVAYPGSDYAANLARYKKAMAEPSRQSDTGVPGPSYVDQG